jgi:chromate transporter
VATLSIFLPSLLVLILVTPYFDRFQSSAYFNRAITGIFASFVGLLLTVAVRFALDVSWNIQGVLLATVALVALLLKVEIIWVVLVGVVISALVF